MNFSPIALDHIQRPRNAGALAFATHVGAGGVPGEGPYVRLSLKMEGERIVAAGFECNGCPSSTAVASMTTQLLVGRMRDEALRLEPNDLLLVLGGLPEGKGSYAELAVRAVKAALDH